MPIIRQLPPSVINKIAAGEVIERPASVVKELMENAIDAGATRIEVTVDAGGMDLVRVSDNGCGMAADDLPLAIASHATSKLVDADDLFRVRTMGFRGEALASIAEVSRLVLRSRQASGDGGYELQVNGGEVRPMAPCGCPIGTTLEVHNLFFNTPVRRKFMRTTSTELGHVTEAFTRIALAHPEVHCTLAHQGRTLHDLPPVENIASRVAAFFGDELARDLVSVDSRDDALRLSGCVALPAHSRSHPRMQYLFLNGRAIRDRSLQHALGEAYRGLLLTGRYPIAFLRIDMPPEMVDVNVHPTKLEVRFQDGGKIYSQLLSTLRTKFLSTDLTHRIEPIKQPVSGDVPPFVPFSNGNDMAALLPRAIPDPARDEINRWAQSQLPTEDERPPAPLEITRLDRTYDPTTIAQTVPAPHRPTSMQVHNRYLVAEHEDGMLVIDQHALHERILYEQLKSKLNDGAIETQALLVPEPVDLSPSEAAAVLEAKPHLAKLGVTVEPFGGSTILVSSYPAMLANIAPAAILRELVDLLLTGKTQPERRDLVDEMLHMVACKAAIKAGDRLSPQEVTALVEQRHLAADTHHCPHGRPTMLVFTREELDKQFKRT